jgi:hypothetical protein
MSGASRSPSIEAAGSLAGAVLGEADQQPEGVPVGGDGVGAGVALAGEAVGEERLQRGGQSGHPCAP